MTRYRTSMERKRSCKIWEGANVIQLSFLLHLTACPYALPTSVRSHLDLHTPSALQKTHPSAPSALQMNVEIPNPPSPSNRPPSLCPSRTATPDIIPPSALQQCLVIFDQEASPYSSPDTNSPSGLLQQRKSPPASFSTTRTSHNWL